MKQTTKLKNIGNIGHRPINGRYVGSKGPYRSIRNMYKFGMLEVRENERAARKLSGGAAQLRHNTSLLHFIYKIRPSCRNGSCCLRSCERTLTGTRRGMRASRVGRG